MDNAIETHELRKTYRGVNVVDGLNLTVRRGEAFGFLGPNGAGKSTTVKMLLGLVRPSGGDVRVLGGHPGARAVRAQLGFLPEQFRFQTWMTAEEFLTFHARLAGLSAHDARARIPGALERVGLAGRARQTLGSFSKGMLQRAGLAQALIHQPALVFLDEPTSALDPIGRVEVREIITALKQDGTSVFLNSHLLSEVEAVCDRVAFVNRGRVLRAGTLRELLGEGTAFVVRARPLTPALHRALEALGTVTPAVNDPDTLHVTLHDPAFAARVAPAVLSAHAELLALVPQQPDLESIFLNLIGRSGSAA
ncbi:ABC transporter ATP-binding protein [Deinococcus maricopensis]|uniref:ABC transporter related protein n=1 Tax=Deinococcus maricopensis (strain DSM 21211 / LMG 22137 / NRRL B-23946 / LB-34) TaxID=709986 RepID=E8UAY2_DEIML|nr:ABC transporter ATP-binding protein [Deinococcus maricopensis]ADV68221.1 ABC transporter related protein [Deinococcus maricopensis DSM 21211]